MEQLIKQVEALKQEMTAFPVANPGELEAFRIRFLGSKGLVKSIMGAMKDVPGPQKKEAGVLLNDLRVFSESLFEQYKEKLSGTASGPSASVSDMSLPGNDLPLGSRHPISIIREKKIGRAHV